MSTFYIKKTREILSIFTAMAAGLAKQYNNIVVSSPELTIGSSYTVTVGGTVTGCDENGYASSGKVTGGEKSLSVEITSISTSYGSSVGNMGGGMGAKPDRESGGKMPF